MTNNLNFVCGWVYLEAPVFFSYTDEKDLWYFYYPHRFLWYSCLISRRAEFYSWVKSSVGGSMWNLFIFPRFFGTAYRVVLYSHIFFFGKKINKKKNALLFYISFLSYIPLITLPTSGYFTKRIFFFFFTSQSI